MNATTLILRTFQRLLTVIGYFTQLTNRNNKAGINTHLSPLFKDLKNYDFLRINQLSTCLF
jgi:hypothetical protein